MDMTRRAAMVVGATLALLVAGCGAPPAAAPRPTSSLDAYLARAFGVDGETLEQQSARVEDLNRRADQAVVDCMHDLGFDYRADGSTTTMVFEGEGEQMDPVEYAKTYDYGLLDWPGRDEQTQQAEQRRDPNAEYYAAMSEAERDAYDQALHGDAAMTPEMSEEDWEAWDTAGCYGMGQAIRRGEDPENPYADLEAGMDDLSTAIWDRPELAPTPPSRR